MLLQEQIEALGVSFVHDIPEGYWAVNFSKGGLAILEDEESSCS